jgi:hypothetical protein
MAYRNAVEKAARVAANVVVASPCTGRSGVSAFKTGSSVSKTRAVSAESVCPGRIRVEIMVRCYLEGL